MQQQRNGMRRIADTNILVHYLTWDDEKAAVKAMEIIKEGVEVLPETISEVLYVLTSKTLYAIPRNVVAGTIEKLLDEISIDRKESIRQALRIYEETKLDYVDCLLIAWGAFGTEVISFDRKLINELKRRR